MGTPNLYHGQMVGEITMSLHPLKNGCLGYQPSMAPWFLLLKLSF